LPPSVLTTQRAPRSRAGEPDAMAFGAARQSERAWLANLYLPAIALLDFHCCPLALWSEDRSRCVFNDSGTALLGIPENDFSAAKDLWLERIHPLDRERFVLAWRSLQDGCGAMVCSYRFMPLDGALTIELEETAWRMAAGPVEPPVVLCRYQVSRPERDASCGADPRNLIHQIGNNLQAVRGEVELLCMFGALPRESFEKITRGIDAIHDLTTQFDGMDRLKIVRDVTGQAVVDNGAGQKSSDAEKS
jgi:PAS domain-containing protein